MSDEQTIYISPEDDLTTVRERLEKLTTRNVTLVIPSQTQLRSHVAWKLLYARARELNKEVLIVSSDPQVRSVAHAVKFKVAHSLESTQAGKSRPASRQGRTNAGSRAKTNPPNARPTGARGQTEIRGSGNTRTRQPASTPQWYAPDADNANFAEKNTPAEKTVTGGLPEARSASFDSARQQQYRTEYDFRIDTSPPIRPLDPEQIEEPDLLLEDYTQAQDIREAASGNFKKADLQPRKESNRTQPSYEIEGLPDLADDPLDYLNDKRAAPLSRPEQRGKASIEGYDTREHVIQDVSDRPTSVIENAIEYQDEREAVRPNPTSPFTRSWSEQSEHPDNEPEVDGPPPPRRVQGTRPRQSRASYIPSPQSQHNLEDDALPPVQLPPPRTARTSRPLPISPAASVPAAPQKSTKTPTGPQKPAKTAASARPAQPTAATRARPNSRVLSQPVTGPSRPGTRRTIPNRGKPARPKWSRRGMLIWIAVILIVIMITALTYFGPSAKVTLTLQARNYNHQVSVIASLKQQSNSVPATLASKDFSKSALEPATGTQTEDKGTASGYVCFNNKSSQPIDIPSLINVATVSGVQFQVQTNTVMPANYTCGPDDSLKIQVLALKPGETGNVLAGSVTMIPDDSLAAIAKQNNVAASDLKLSVSNEKDIVGGGRRPVPAVAANDLTAAKTDLHKKLQSVIDAWTQQVKGSNTTAGPATTQDELINPPAVNSIEEPGNFTASIKVHVSILSVKNSDLQQAAITQLNSQLQKDKNYANYMVSTDTGDTTPVVKIDQLQINGNASTATFTFNASVQAIPIITEDLRPVVTGKTVAEGRSVLQSIPHVKTADIEITPGFFPRIPYWPDHIDVKILPAAPTPPTKTK